MTTDLNTLSTYQVVMPRLGLTMTEARIMQWLCADGARVEKGQPLFAIENEKATLEIEAPASGRLKILQPEGAVVPILQPVALLEDAGQAPAHHTTAAQAPGGSSVQKPAAGLAPSAPPPHETAPVRATPKARALARESGLDLRELPGSGPRGMIVAADVQEAVMIQTEAPPAPAAPHHISPLARKVAAEQGLDLSQVAGTGPRGWVMRQDVEALGRSAAAAAGSGSPFFQTQQELPGGITPLSGLRAVIADRLSTAWRDRPQVTLTTEADATALVLARQGINAELAASGGKVSYDAILVKLVARALAELPYMNRQWTEQGIYSPEEINIGVAVDTDRGLLVPVLQGAGQKNLREINEELQQLAVLARKGRLAPEQLSGGTFTITNLGMYEIDAFTPVINPPECAILGVGRIVAKPVGWNGQVALREMMALSLSFDHRMVDGAPAARFLQRIKLLVERPFVLAYGE